MSDRDGEVVELRPWLTVDFEHFSAVRHRNGPWTHIFLRYSGFEINLEKLGLLVELSDDAIVFLGSRTNVAESPS